MPLRKASSSREQPDYASINSTTVSVDCRVIRTSSLDILVPSSRRLGSRGLRLRGEGRVRIASRLWIVSFWTVVEIVWLWGEMGSLGVYAWWEWIGMYLLLSWRRILLLSIRCAFRWWRIVSTPNSALSQVYSFSRYSHGCCCPGAGDCAYCPSCGAP